MSADRVQIDTVCMLQAARKLADVHDLMDAVQARHRAALVTHGNGCGGDAIGARFGALYRDLVEQASVALTSYREQVGCPGELLPIYAACFADVERWTVDDLRWLLAELAKG
jgi:hypothetical protein